MPLKSVIFALCFFFSFTTGFCQSTASPQVQVCTIEAPQLDSIRTIRVYLPNGYETSMDHYPVIYMHDAQNLFDASTSFSGEWKVDEFLDEQDIQKVIVVGIDHGNDKRITELTPFPNEEYGGGEGAAYLDFIVNTLKPHVDNNFRTLPYRENTAVIGSSLGGLISFYAGLKHPDIFGKVGVFSPSFWFSEEIFHFAEASKMPENPRFYLLGGTAESESMMPQLLEMKQLMLRLGLPPENLKLKLVEGGQHNEAFWSREFPEAFKWLFTKQKP